MERFCFGHRQTWQYAMPLKIMRVVWYIGSLLVVEQLQRSNKIHTSKQQGIKGPSYFFYNYFYYANINARFLFTYQRHYI